MYDPNDYYNNETSFNADMVDRLVPCHSILYNDIESAIVIHQSCNCNKVRKFAYFS